MILWMASTKDILWMGPYLSELEAREAIHRLRRPPSKDWTGLAYPRNFCEYSVRASRRYRDQVSSGATRRASRNPS